MMVERTRQNDEDIGSQKGVNGQKRFGLI